MIDLKKSQEITLTVDPFTFLTLDHLAKIKDITLEEFAANILINNPTVWSISEKSFQTWIKRNEEE